MKKNLKDIDMAEDSEFIPVREAIEIVEAKGFTVTTRTEDYIRWKNDLGTYSTLMISRDGLVDGRRIKS